MEIITKEKHLQKFLEDYLRVHNIEYYRFPDWGFSLLSRLSKNPNIDEKDRNAIIKILSLLKGYPDCKVFIKILNTPFFFGMDIELKSKKGKLNKNQIGKGFCVCKTPGEIVAAINSLREEFKYFLRLKD